MSIYEMTVRDITGNDISMETFRGKVLLIVNTATGCGFTPQYEGLQKLYETYGEKGLEILDFPCNQFAGQAPGTEEEIVTFCKGRFGVTFRQFAKIDVNGDQESPLFAFLKSQIQDEAVDGIKDKATMKIVEKLSTSTKKPGDIRWNFTKFLVDREGNVIGRFAPTVKPEELEQKILEVL